jgi:UDP-GlcNAc:undecaprenyl-phosphate GlcNAc-1-phosphate transferase
MLIALAAFSAALAFSASLTPLIRNRAARSGLVDHGLTSRKIHGRPIPRLGGIAIVAAFYVPLLALQAFDSGAAAAFGAASERATALFAGGLVIAALGLYDDLRGATARTKLFVQFSVAAVAYGFGYRIDAVALPLVGVIELGPLGVPLTLLWIAGVINAFNLIDGLDGLAGGVALVTLVSVFSIALGAGDALLILVAATLAGAVLGFLFFNFNPASIFMGDTGSMFLGFALATTSIQASHRSPTAVALLVPVIALGLPIADTLLAMARRALRGAPLFSADRGHIHHRLLARGLSQRETVLTLYGFCACLGGTAMVVFGSSDGEALLALSFLAAGGLAVMRWLGFLDWNSLGEVLCQRRRNVERRRRLAVVASQLDFAAEAEGIAATLAQVGPVLEVDHVALRASGRSWTYGSASRKDLRVVSYGLRPERPGADVLEIGWVGGHAVVDRDVEIAIELLCGHVRAALRRVDGAAANGRGERAPKVANG